MFFYRKTLRDYRFRRLEKKIHRMEQYPVIFGYHFDQYLVYRPQSRKISLSLIEDLPDADLYTEILSSLDTCNTLSITIEYDLECFPYDTVKEMFHLPKLEKVELIMNEPFYEFCYDSFLDMLEPIFRQSASRSMTLVLKNFSDCYIPPILGEIPSTLNVIFTVHRYNYRKFCVLDNTEYPHISLLIPNEKIKQSMQLSRERIVQQTSCPVCFEEIHVDNCFVSVKCDHVCCKLCVASIPSKCPICRLSYF